jgi:FSR family fosmidomycin resistance protein-like MFS transporter
VAALLAVAHTANDALMTMPAVLLPSFEARFGLSEAALAAFVAVLWVSSSVTQPIFGALADRFDRRAMAAAGVALSSVMLGLLGVAPAAWLLFALALMAGLGSAALHPVGSTLARDEGGRWSSLAVSLFSAGGMLGYAIGPLLALAVVAALGLGGTPWLMVPGLLLAVALLRGLPRDGGRAHRHAAGARLLDAGLLRGPIGALVVAGVLADMAFVTFTSAMPLWLVREGGMAPDAPVIGWTLAAFALAASAGSVLAGVLVGRLGRRPLAVGSMLLALPPLLVALRLEPGGTGFYVTVALGGALVYASFPLLIMAAQDLAPHAVATATGMLMGLSTGIAGLLYIGIGVLQGTVGFTAATVVAYLALVPGAALAYVVLGREGARSRS